MRNTCRTKSPAAPKVGPISISTRDIRWLHSEGWDRNLTEYFAAKSSELPLLIFAAPSFVFSRKRTLYRRGRWILTRAGSDNPLSWAEVQLMSGNFKEAWLTVGSRTEDFWKVEENDSHLSLLISMILISTGADLITLSLSTQKDRETFQASLPEYYGERRELLSPTRTGVFGGPSCPSLARLSTRRFSKTEWEAGEGWKKDRETLNYLVKKVQALEHEVKSQSKAGTKGGRSALNRFLERITARLRN